MIIWIDGVYGIGKSSVALELKKMLNMESVRIIEVDSLYINWIKDKIISPFGGTLPQNNLQFLNRLREYLIKAESENRFIIIPNCLLSKESEKILKDLLVGDHKRYILFATKDTVFNRIDSDESRDKSFAKNWYDFFSSYQINNSYNYKKINTNNKEARKVAKEIYEDLLADGLFER